MALKNYERIYSSQNAFKKIAICVIDLFFLGLQVFFISNFYLTIPVVWYIFCVCTSLFHVTGMVNNLAQFVSLIFLIWSIVGDMHVHVLYI